MKNIVVLEKELEEIKKIIIKLCKETKSDLVWVGDKEGHQVICHWERSYCVEENISYLIRKIINKCAEKEKVKMRNAIAYIYNIDKELSLILIASKEIDFDIVCVLIKEALNKINKIFQKFIDIVENTIKVDVDCSNS